MAKERISNDLEIILDGTIHVFCALFAASHASFISLTILYEEKNIGTKNTM